MQRRAALGALLNAPAFAQHAQRASTAGPRVQVLPERLPMAGLDRERTLRLYLPPSYAAQSERRYPAIYFHDGQNLFDDATSFAGEWGVDETLDALAQATGFEAIAVGIDHGGDRRTQEMLPRPHGDFRVAEGDAYVDFIARTVKPWMDARFRTRPEREHTATVGSSLGGLMAQHALARHPQVFGKAGVLSPAYWAAPSMFETVLAPGARVCLYAGTAESQTMVPLVERMHALLNAQPGVQAALHLAPGARHNESAWRAELPLALRWLFNLT
jgi:predicted alpha/beta superfamily hydrolase